MEVPSAGTVTSSEERNPASSRVKIVEAIIADLFPDFQEKDRTNREKIRLECLKIANKIKSLEGAVKLAGQETENWKQKAQFDLMTGLYNKVTFFELFDKECADSEKEKNGRSFLLSIDLDFLKAINTRSAKKKEGGNQALLAIASAISESFQGKKYIAGRAGGDEFFVSVSGIESDRELMQMVANFAGIIGRTKIEGYDKKVSVSVGCVEVRLSTYSDTHQLVEWADRAAELSKINGRDAFTLLTKKARGDDLDSRGRPIAEKTPDFSYRTYRHSFDKEGNPNYNLDLNGGDVETASTSRDTCEAEVRGSLDRVEGEIFAHFNGDFKKLLLRFNVTKFSSLKIDDIVEILFHIRNNRIHELFAEQ